MPQSSQNEVRGFASPENGFSDAGAQTFIVEQILSNIQTIMLVKVVGVTNNGGVSPVGFVDVVPMVYLSTADNKTIAHATIHNIPYFRLQGGSNAIIIDPKVGDIGMCGFCSRDISSVKKTKQPSAAQSKRRFAYSDGLYFGGMLNGAPSQYVRFSDAGIEIKSPSEIILEAPSIKFKGNTETTGTANQMGAMTNTTITASGDVSSGGKSFLNHTHQENDNHGQTGVPT